MSRMLAIAAALVGAAILMPSSAEPVAAAALPRVESADNTASVATEVRYRRGPVGYYYRPAPRVYLYSAPPVVTYYGAYGGGHCAWLHRQARNTGSPYWWRRYRYEC